MHNVPYRYTHRVNSAHRLGILTLWQFRLFCVKFGLQSGFYFRRPDIVTIGGWYRFI